MLKETTLYTAICDRCEKQYPYHFATEKDLEDYMPKAGWHDTGQLHFCPDCYTTDQNGEIKLKPQINETND